MQSRQSRNELRKMPLVMKRIKAVRDFRLASKKAATRRRAETPTLFAEDRFIDAPALIIPRTSSGDRRYIPMGFIDGGAVINLEAMFISNATLYHFGVLTSSTHMAWVRTVAGRLGTGYRYGVQTVYNTFPWLRVSDKQRAMIERSAQKILDVRKNYPAATLADLYDELTMPADLRAAHKKNDAAVAQAYGFTDMTEAEIVAALMKLYERLTNK